MAVMPILSSPTVDLIYAGYEAREALKPARAHLGASEIGRECERELWYRFRWALPKRFEGRMLRLFQTGHIEEARLIQDLKDIGLEVHSVDPETGQQWAFQVLGGHFSGSADAVIKGLLEAPKTFHLFEAKTHNLKSYTNLIRHGVAKHKPEHYAQMIIYMYMLGIKRAAYFAVCKDDDRIHLERVYPDPDLAKKLLHKAERIIFSAYPPERVSLDPESWACGYCDFRELCHPQLTSEPVWAQRNCRTCLASSPVEDEPIILPGGGHHGRWLCERRGYAIDLERQRSGCGGDHRYHPDLVQGEQTDADPKTRRVTYTLKDTTEWHDVGQAIPGPTDAGAVGAVGEVAGPPGLG